MTESKTKFTPGPWRVRLELDYGISIRAENGGRLYRARWAAVSSRAKTIDDVRNGVGFDERSKPPFDKASIVRAVERQIADWTLFAAAPDLYAQCELFERTINFYIADDERKGDHEGAGMKRVTLEILRAVLRRARGEG